MLSAPLRATTFPLKPPIPRRLPTRKAMTIAVGVLATDGVVLAADTQLTIPNFWKGEGGKISAITIGKRDGMSGSCAVTGATNRYEYLQALGDEVTRDFRLGLQDNGKAVAFDRFAAVIHRFHERHVVPYPHDLPEVNVLIAYQRDSEIALWQSSRSAVVEQHDFGAVGIGSFAANAWLDRVWKHGLDVPTAVIVATFATAVC